MCVFTITGKNKTNYLYTNYVIGGALNTLLYMLGCGRLAAQHASSTWWVIHDKAQETCSLLKLCVLYMYDGLYNIMMCALHKVGFTCG